MRVTIQINDCDDHLAARIQTTLVPLLAGRSACISVDGSPAKPYPVAPAAPHVPPSLEVRAGSAPTTRPEPVRHRPPFPGERPTPPSDR